MSCIVDQVASISNTSELAQWLCPHLAPNVSQSPSSSGSGLMENADWNDAWGDWDDAGKGDTLTAGGDGDVSMKSSSPQPETSWLSESVVAASPTSELMAVGYKNRLVILTCRWEGMSDEDGKMRLVTTWRGTVGFTPSDEISAILCLPLLSQKQSSAGGPDWTCIIVGFTSGHVAMYTENGLILLSQLFEEGSVISLKCRTLPSGSAATLVQDMSEELIILYPRSITTIDGFSLFQTLRGCRNQVAKAAASGGENVSVPPLGYKKWGLVDQVVVADCVAPGVTPPFMYDHMSHTSLSKGCNHTFTPGVPATSLLVTVGRVPFVGFLCAHEGTAPPFVADVALHYANKLKDALVSAASGWLFGKSKGKDPEKSNHKPKIEPATPLPCKSSVPDKRRTGLSVSLAAGRRLAAVTDDFGRVTLIDVNRGICLRMWKGYRDADCGWLDVESEWGGSKRRVSFLLIYAPRRGLLEVWTPQQGPRVAAFNVPKYSRLIYTPHTLLGVNSVRGVRCKVFPVIFVTQDGTISEISIPFHLALGGKTSKRARDLHLVKTLKSQLKNGNEEEVMATMAEIKTLGVRKQAIMTFVMSQHLTTTLLQAVLEYFLPLYNLTEEEGSSGDAIPTQDHESRLLGQQLLRLRQLLSLYSVLCELHSVREASPDPDDEIIVLELAKLLVLTPEETKTVLLTFQHPDLNKPSGTKKVKFSDVHPNISIGSFLRCWDVSVGALVKGANTAILPVNLKGDINYEKKLKLGEFLYGWAWHRESVKSFGAAIQSSGANPESLLHVALVHWTLCPHPDTVATLHFGTILHSLSRMAGEKVLCDISSQSPWWSAVRDKLLASTQPFHACIAALLCRGVHARLEIYFQQAAEQEIKLRSKVDPDADSQKEPAEENDQQPKEHYSSLNDWEGLSMEMVEWNLVINQLESLLPLHLLLSHFPPNGPDRQPKLDVSVKALLEKGRGFVGELIANWFIGSGLPLDTVERLLRKQDKLRERRSVEDQEPDVPCQEEKDASDKVEKAEPTEDDDNMEIMRLLIRVGEKFPHSVAADTVLTNMAWELAAAWHKAADDTNLISRSVAHIARIKNSHIRHGVALMIWETWVCQCIQSASSLMDKVGRLPKDRLCRRDLGIGEHSMSSLFQIVLLLLEQVMEANVVCEVEKPLVMSPDRFWLGMEGSPSLVELTVMQKMSCYDLVYQHYQLVMVLFLVTHHNLKSVRPLSYVDGKGRSVLFKPLTTSWTIGGYTEGAVAKSRLGLLCRVITAAVSSLPDDGNQKQDNPTTIHQVLDLGRAWGVSLDVLHRHYICELYTSAQDTMAEEALPLVNDGPLLGSQLVMIAGQRLHYLLVTSERTAHHMALTSPTITEWVKSCDSGSLRCPDVPLDRTLQLLTRAVNLLQDSSQEYKMATALYDTVLAFLKDKSNS
ncbi:rab3 GTPase-activating protein non-catalytic subunit-like [Macrobrachium nipponense]|uniref:rab3 GTPase-activating protein non-catalytic subunit-like n=1 Tax=Macrobrachium nipponense TaxID=159736 RepID=UPI0030C8B540